MAFKIPEVTSEDHLLIQSTHVVENLSDLKDRSIGLLSSIFNYSKNRTLQKNFKKEVKNCCDFLTSDQIEEIQNVFFTVRNKITGDNFYKLKKHSLISFDKRCQFSYLIRPNDLLVHTGVCIGSGNSKTVDLILKIEKSGEVGLLVNAKLKKDKRNYKYNQLFSYEYKVRKLFDSDKVLSPGERYAYSSKKGIAKLTWIVPYYSNISEAVKVKEGYGLSSILERERLPLKTLKVCLNMALALREMHKIDWIHRDVKLENFLVDIDNKTGELKDLVIADTAFAIPVVSFDQYREETVESLKRKFIKKIGYTEDQLRKRNQIFFRLSLNNEFPSVERYSKSLESKGVKDLDSNELIEFLQKLDTSLIVGTPNHIAPEVYETRRYSKSVDIYALGASFFKIKKQMETVALFNEKVDEEFDSMIYSLGNREPKIRLDLDKIVSKLESMIDIQNQ